MRKLTNAQKSIWVTEQYYKGSPVNSICGYAMIGDKVDFNKLEQAIQIVCKKHDNFWLRLKIENGEVKQTLAEKQDVKLITIEVEDLKEMEKEAKKIVNTLFKIENSELFQIYIFKFKNGQGAFMPNVHHLISDGWTFALISNEVIKAYSALIQNKEVETKAIYSYLDYIKSEQEYMESEKFQKDKVYWEEKFATIPEVATIPGSKANGDLNNPKGNRKKYKLDEQEVAKIKQYCKENKISIYNFLMAIYGIYIGEISNLDEFVIGTPILNRTNFKEKSAMGMFVNMAPLKIDMTKANDFKTFVKNIALDSIGMLKHQKYSYQCLLENLREKNKTMPNLYNILLSYQITNAHQSDELVKYKTDWIFNGCCAENMDIQISDFNDTGSLDISYDYKTSIYEDEDIEKMHKRILHIIEQVIEKQDIELKEIEIVTPKEKEKLLTEFNQTELKYNPNIPIIKYFEEQAENTPNNTAIVFENKRMTYKELNEKANSLAYELRKNGVTNNTIVGIMQERSFEMIIAILAVLKAGGGYIPIATDYPADRIQYMLEDSNASILLAETNEIKTDKTVLSIRLDNKFYDSNKENLENISKPEDLSYLIYTSGSTGTPKGVMLKQKNLTNFYHAMLQNIEYLTAKEPIKIISITTLSFDIFIFETLMSLTRGLTLYMTNENEQKVTEQLENKIKENGIQAIQTTPSIMKFHLDNIKNKENLKSLKYIMLAGEPLPKTLVDNIKQLIPGVKVYNGYGPSETTIFSTTRDVTNLKEVTIGRPIANTQIYILNKNKKILPQGCIGEMYIAGDGVGKGYMNKKEQTESSFTKNPFLENSIMYKSGDLGSFDENGEIICYGRVDNQIKIRGLRVELPEIEKQMLSIDNIQNVVVVKKEINGRAVLCAYHTESGRVDLNDIKELLQNKLPQYMIPQYFVKLDKMPYTPNGKIDKKLLPMPDLQEKAKEKVEIKNEIDKELVQIIQKMMHIENINLSDTLLDLGGDSLTAITLVTKISSKFNVQINIKDILSNKTIKEISDIIKENQSRGFAEIKIEKATKQETYPLSSAQKRIYYNSQMIGEENLVYNTTGGIIVDEILEHEKLEKAFNKIIERHSSLRTSFILKDTEVVQKICENVQINIPVYHNTEKEVQDIIQNFAKPFKLDEDLLLRVELHYIDNKKTLLLVDSHHIIMDGTALNNLIKEFEKLYNGENLKELKLQYIDYAVWENKFNESEEIKQYEEYWVNKLKKAELSQLNLPYDYKTSANRSYKGSKISNIIDEKQFRKIENYAKKLGVSPYVLFISAFFILLYKYTGQEEITLGSPISNRDINETEKMIGMFVNNIVVKANINSEESFQEFVNGIKEQILDDLSNQPYPFDMLVRKLGIKADNSRNPLFDVMFTYQNQESEALKLGEHEVDIIEIDNNISKFDLSLEVKPKSHIINIEYCTDLFKKHTVERFFEHYMNVLDRVVTDNDVKIADISIISEQEKNKILYEFNDTKLEYNEKKTISQLIEEQVKTTPNDVAIVFEEKSITYKELNEKSNQVANYLRNSGINPNEIVGIMLPRSLELLISIIGVLKSGACYVPIDPTYPEQRIEYMLENSQAKLLIISKELYNNIEFKNKVCVDSEEITHQSYQNLKSINTPEDMSYIIYTSGSTGLPKGVILKQKSLSNLCAFLNKKVEFLQPGCEYKNIASVTTASFDIFIFETLICLQKGLKIILANEEEQRIPKLLDRLISKNNVQIIQMTPSRMQLFIDNIDDMPNLTDLKYVTLAGEPLPSQLRDKLVSLGVKKVYNGYGPSETTVFSTFTDVTTCKEINIGVPLGNTQMYILDKNLKIVPIGVAGELYIAGDGVGKGYLNREDITKERYINNPFIENSIMYKTGDICKFDNNGEIYYLGRTDNQVKIRGLRIELEEIENKMLEFPFIKKAKVIKQVIGNRDIISAYFIATREIRVKELRKYLFDNLPNYMVPSYFTSLFEFPYTPNGKIDKNKLAELLNEPERNYETILPANQTEEKLSKIFKKVLSLSEISTEDNFFELGGDSIIAMRLQIEASRENLNITYQDVFNYPTIKELAVQAKQVINNTKIEKCEEAEFYPVSSAQKRMYLASSVENSTLYNITGGILMDRMPNIDKMQEAINKIIEKHDVLRTYFEIGNDGEITQRIEPKLDIKIAVINVKTNNTDEIFDMYQEPFDLNQTPLLRTFLAKMPNGKVLFILDIHHIIFDGISLKLFLKEISDIYNGKELNETTISYKDFSVWEGRQLENNELKTNKEFWTRQFENDIPVLNMPTNYPRTATKSYSGNTFETVISNALTEKIEKLAKMYNVTPYMIMLSVYYILLYRYTGQEDIVIGTAVSGRNHNELEAMLGMFVNSLPLRQQISAEDSFNKFLLNIKNYCINCFSNQNYPYDMLINDLEIKKDASRNPLFDTMFTYQGDIFSDIDLNGINAQYCIPKSKTSKFDISLEAIPVQDKIELHFEYCTDLFNDIFINKFSTHYYNILKNIIENPEIKIKDISILEEEEKNKILYEFNNNKLDYPKEQNVVELFKEQVSKNRNAIAVKYNNEQITYQELDEKSNHIANVLKQRGIKTGDVVGINLNRSIELIISMMGVLKIGAIYMPMYTEYPKERLEYMLQNSNAKLMICKKEREVEFNGIKEIIADYKDIKEDKQVFEEVTFSTKEIAYIIYTSGSTGKPKGVQIKHENLINFIYAFKEYYKNKIDNTDNFLASTNISFDVSIWEIFLPILNGASLVLYEEEIIKDIFKYAESIAKNEITGLYIPPNILEEVYNIIKEKEVKIDKLLVGVEPIRKDVLNKYYNLNQKMIIINGYGPTETTICCTALEYMKDLSEGIVSIGKPLKNNNIYILSKDKNIQPIGVEGEIYVTGSGVGNGYINREEETKKNFLPNIFDKDSQMMYKTGDIAKWNEDGTIKFKGRNDNQVKIAGHRIELNEINHAIMEYPSVIKAFTDIKKKGEISYIVSYYVSEKEIPSIDLKLFLKEKLAEFMVPNFLIQIDKFPLTPNGKIDKEKLTVDFLVKKQYIEPRDDFEKKLVKIFKKLLLLKNVGIDDNFFELGGDSLTAIKFQVEALNEGLKITYSDIFSNPTIRLLSENKNKKITYKIDNKYDYSKINEILAKNDISNLKNKVSRKKLNNVLLIGATGYLGIHILEQLILSNTNKIYCLVRKKSSIEPETRLKDYMKFYFGDKYNYLIGNKIIVVDGDITNKKFGQTNDEEYNNLAQSVDCVIHTAAIVKYYGDFKKFNDTNVEGTINVIDFCKKYNKKMYYISTLSVSGNISRESENDEARIFKENELYINQNLNNVYVFTKFEAEKKIFEAIGEGLNACILRIGNMTNRYSDGKFQINVSENAFISKTKSIIKLGVIQDKFVPHALEFTPVEYCAESIVKIAESNPEFTVFHLFNDKFLNIGVLIEILEKLGLSIKTVSDEEFKKKVDLALKDTQLRSEVSGIIPGLDKDKLLNIISSVIPDSTFTKEYLKYLDFEWPDINEDYIRKYVEYLKKIKYI